MFVAAVAGVDHRHIGMLRHRLHRAVPIVADDQHVGVTGNHLRRVRNSFAFGG